MVAFGITELLLVVLIFIVGMSITANKQIVVLPSAPASPSQGNQMGGDDRYRRAPRPQRFWEAEPEIPTRGVLDPIATRGAPESYQQMGVIMGSDGKPLPLYGRRVAPRSDRFNYYTRTDTYNPVALPVSFKKRDCQDNLGCDEVSSGDSVKISPTGETAKITLYGFDGPRYSPDTA